MKNIPLTIQVRNYGNLDTKIVLSSYGQPFYQVEAFTYYEKSNEYCVVVLQRSDLKIVTSFTFTDNSSVPSQLSPYLGNADYTFIFTTNALSSANLPTGALYDWLISEGAGTCLKSLEQLYAGLNCGNWGAFSYALVGVFGSSDEGGAIEGMAVQQNALLMTLEYQPVTVAGNTFYTPIELR